MAATQVQEFPCTLVLEFPFPTAHLASVGLKSLSVDAELSPLVRRSFELATAPDSSEKTILKVNYSATTNRMLRVAVTGFFESLGVVIGVMRELDEDVYDGDIEGDLKGVQGLEEAVEG